MFILQANVFLVPHIDNHRGHCDAGYSVPQTIFQSKEGLINLALTLENFPAFLYLLNESIQSVSVLQIFLQISLFISLFFFFFHKSAEISSL